MKRYSNPFNPEEPSFQIPSSPRPRASRNSEDLAALSEFEAMGDEDFSLNLNDLLGDQDPIGELLSKSSFGEPPPWLITKTMARLRKEEASATPWAHVWAELRTHLNGHGRLATSVCTLALLTSLVWTFSSSSTTNTGLAEAFELLNVQTSDNAVAQANRQDSIQISEHSENTTAVQEAFEVVATNPAPSTMSDEVDSGGTPAVF